MTINNLNKTMIPFNKPFLCKEELLSVIKVIKSGKIGGNGPVTRKVETLMKRLFGVRFAFLTTSCSHALEIAIMALGIGRGDEVILPSFSFVSAANAIVRANAKPVFVDIEDKYLNIDAGQIRKRITPRTKAIICIHYAGFPCRMEEIKDIARESSLYVIEDAAQAVGSKFKGKSLGAIGDIGCFSFHETKNLSCGEGGAFLTNDERLAQKAEIIREKGTNRSDFIRGKIDKYSWIDIGSSYVLSDILAALLFTQFLRLKYITEQRKAIGLRYMEKLRGLADEKKIILPSPIPIGYASNWHIFYFRVPNQRIRDEVISKLRRRGIEAGFHFVPLHLSPYARKAYKHKEGSLPITENVSKTLIRLPIYPGLTRHKQDYIIDSLYNIFK